MVKMIEAVVKKEMKGLENLIHSISGTIKEEVLQAVQKQLKETLDGFRDVFESGSQNNKRTNDATPTPKCFSVNDASCAFIKKEKDEGNDEDVEPGKLKVKK